VNISDRYSEEARAVLFTGDCLDLLSQIPDESVQLVVTSPPYNIGKRYDKKQTLDDYLASQEKVIQESVRVLKKGGSICWEVGNHVVGAQEIIPRGNITSADQATGLLADLECVSEDSTIVLAVEVKDRALTISQLRGKIPSIRERQAFEVFFVAQQGVPRDEVDETQDIIDHEFISGHNIYITDLLALARVVFALIGEAGRSEFLFEVGKQLEQHRSDIRHRRAWARLLSTT